jgi:hypothetical protein
VLAIVVVTLGLAFGTATGRHQLALSFTRLPAPYVALYFPHDPPVAVAGNRITVTFTVADHEGGEDRYGYDVRVLDGSGRQVGESSGEVAVGPDLTSTTSADVVLPRDVGWARVEVNLTGRSEAIHYAAPPDTGKQEGQ